MDIPNWKNKLSTGQLERKRLLDRTNRRRARLGSKQTQEDRRQQFINLLGKEDCSLLHRLVTENARLLEIHDECQSKIESLVHWSQDCLEFTHDPSLILGFANSRNDGSPPSKQRTEHQQSAQLQDLALSISHHEAADTPRRCGVKPSSDKLPIRQQPSIISQISLTLRNQRVDIQPDSSVTNLVESFIIWKTANGGSLGSEHLVFHLALEDAPMYLTWKKVKSAICQPNFYKLLHRALYHDESIPVDEPNDTVLNSLMAMPALIQQRRSIAYLSYVALQPYREFFRDLPEYLASYSISYAYFIFLSFPTEKNLRQFPVWLWPTQAQFENEHPGNIDFFAWPILRDEMARTSQKYNVRSLTHFIVENLELCDFPGKYGSRQIMLKTDLSDLELSPAFQEGIFDLQNYTIKEPFRERFPELSKMIDIPNICWLKTVGQSHSSLTDDEPTCLCPTQNTAACLAESDAQTFMSNFTLDDQSLSAIFDSTSPWTDFSVQFPELCDFNFSNNTPGSDPEQTWGLG